MIRVVTGHEWRLMRSTTLFWLLLALAQLIVGWLTFAQLEVFASIAPQLKAGASSLDAMDLVITPTLNSLVLVMLVAVPLLAMGSLAGETRSGRIALWLSTPASGSDIVLGKTLGIWLGCLALIAGPVATLVALGFAVPFDWQRFALAVAFLMLFGFWLASVTLMLSGLFDHPAAALAAAYGLLFFLWLLDSFTDAGTPWYGFALLPHVEPWFTGLLRSQDIVFFATTAAAALLATTFRLARQRGET